MVSSNGWYGTRLLMCNHHFTCQRQEGGSQVGEREAASVCAIIGW